MWVGSVLSTGGSFGGVGLLSVCVGPAMSSMVVMLRACAAGDGFHALHWNMFSCLRCWASVLRCLSTVCFLSGESGGLILCFWGFGVFRVVGVGVSSFRLACFFCGCCGGIGEEESGWVCLSVVTVFLFRVEGVSDFRVVGAMLWEVCRV